MQRRAFLSLAGAGVATAALWPQAALWAAAPTLVKLSSNENPIGMSPLGIAAAKEALKQGHRYGDDSVDNLAMKIAGLEKLEAGSVTIANGSTGILEAVMRMAAVRHATLVQPAITYGDAKLFAKSGKLTIQSVPMKPDFETDLAGMERAANDAKGPVIVYLVTPNNPTGRITPYKDIAAWVKRAPADVFFLIDEAYHELVDDPAYQSCAKLVQEGQHKLIVARTFSKLYAMAGMRVGYGLASPTVIKKIQTQYSSWSVNVPAVEAASASLDDHAFQARSLKSNQQAKAITYAGLSMLNLKYIPTEGNFLIHQIRMDLRPYQQAMRKRGFKVGRDMGLGYGWNRLSLGTGDQMAAFISALKDIQEGGWKG